MDQQELAWFALLDARLHEQLDDVRVRARLRENIELLRRLADTLAADAAGSLSQVDSGELHACAGGCAVLPPLFRAFAEHQPAI